MARVFILGLALLGAGVAFFCFCPGNVAGPQWEYVSTPDGPELVKHEMASDGWIALGGLLCLAGWVVLLLGAAEEPPPAGPRGKPGR